MFGFLKSSSSKTFLGIDINPERISVAQVKKQGNKAKLVHYHSAPLPEGAMMEGRVLDPPTVGTALASLLSDNRIPAGPVALAVPAREAIVRLIRLPADLPAEELRRVVLEQEAELYIPYPRDQADVDFQALENIEVGPDGVERNEVLLVAIPKEVVDNYLEVLQSASLRAQCVELTSFSVIRTIRDQLSQVGPQEATLLTSVGYESSEITILMNGIPQFSRTVNIGTVHMQQVLSQALNLPSTRTGELLLSLKLPVVSPTETLAMGEQPGSNPGVTAVSRVLNDLADELRRSMDFYINQERSSPVVKVILGGAGAGMNQVDGFLAQRLSMPVELVDPLSSLNVPDSLDIPLNERPGMGVALGLGLREF